MKITILHLSDLQFGRHHVNKVGQRQPLYADENYNSELQKLIDDLNILAEDGIVPNFIVITGDIAEWSLQEEYKQAEEFIVGICRHLNLDRRYIVMVPGNHDINRKLCEASRLTAQAKNITFNPPYYAKFEHYADFFNGFYEKAQWKENDHQFGFSEERLFVNFYYPEHGVIFVGLNSCIDESECDPHYGNITVEQLRKATLEAGELDREKSLLRIAVLHHNFQRGSNYDEENLKDRDDLLPLFLKESYHLILHGHRHVPQKGLTGEGDMPISILATGSAGLDSEALPANCRRYQVINIIDNEIYLYKRFFDCNQVYLSGIGCWKPDLNPEQRNIYEKFKIANFNPPKRKLQIVRNQQRAVELSSDFETKASKKSLKPTYKGITNRSGFEPYESDIIKLMESERSGHLQYFSGRDDLIQKIKRLMEEFKTGEYILLTGSEAKGKSAVCAALTESFFEKDCEKYAHTMNEEAPWLPSFLFISGKVVKEPKQILRLLLAQANTLLIEPIKSSLCLGEDKNYYDGLSSNSETVISINNSYSNSFSSTTSPLKMDYHMAGRLSTKLEKHNNICAVYRKEIYLLMEKLVNEIGRVYLIIDALDEMNSEALEVLPERMPNNVSTLLTVRLGTDADIWVKDYLKDYKPIKLDALSRDEIPLITGVDDYESDEHRKFNDIVMRKTGGWPLLVIDVAQKVKANGGDFSVVSVDEKADIVLENRANLWSAVNDKGQDVLREILFLLAIFEPVCSLDLGLVQAYLIKRFEQTIELQLLRKELRNVASQIDGLNIGKIKLSLQIFGEYVRDRHCSQRELNEHMKAILNWIVQDEDVRCKMVVDFLLYWTNREKISKLIFQTTSGIFDVLIENKRADILIAFALEMSSSEFSLKCLKAAATIGDENAMALLGLSLLHEMNGEKDVLSGEFWIREAAEKDCKLAMMLLGHHLIDGDAIAKDAIEGLQWLEKAALAGEGDATFHLAVRHLDGDGLERDIVKGERLLREAANAGNERAIIELANRLIDGRGLAENIQEGLQLLYEVIDSGSISAMRNLAKRLIQGVGVEVDKEKGIEIFRKASCAGDIKSSIDLSEILLDNKMTDDEHIEGEELLRKAAKKSEEAQVSLGRRLITGKGVKPNVKAGEIWLRKAIAGDSDAARIELAEYLIEGKFLKRNVNEGKRLLLTAIEKGYIDAMRYLGGLLLEGKYLTRNKQQGIQLLLKAIAHGDEPSMLYLGSCYLYGDVIKQNVSEGERLLNSAIDSGYLPAMYAMGDALLSGEVLAQNIPAAISFLERAARAYYTPAQCKLGIFYYDQGMYDDATKMFLNAFTSGSSVAGINIAYMKRRGEFVDNVSCPPIQNLLIEGLKEKEPYALINQALCLASGFECKVDWTKADNIIASMEILLQEDVEWWLDLRLKDDAEAHLVIGWLVRHQLLIDPDGLTSADRMTKAKREWDIPEWLFLNKITTIKKSGISKK
ncbi:metallophosphoesterase [Sporomusa sp. KB1]|jgi:TPR repeat protein/predicted phosphodiesterase|uniref:metallophosphoesterase n=1 Tax=Sporomusa sp. KB1 TaxID=943346 RepID=UPI0011AA5796|nr:metallophosphoesterase [Sporomusa sp. KB1]TWH45942.1 TPR repeat protein [Sporomusa sp. KB1]